MWEGVCRVCLRTLQGQGHGQGHAQGHSLVPGSPHHRFYAIITSQNTPQNTEDLFLCYYCFHILEKMTLFSQLCIESNIYLSSLQHEGEFNPEEFYKDKQGLFFPYSLSPSKITCTSYGTPNGDELAGAKFEDELIQSQQSDPLTRVKYENMALDSYCDNSPALSPDDISSHFLLDEESKIKVEMIAEEDECLVLQDGDDEDDLIPLKFVKVRKKRKQKLKSNKRDSECRTKKSKPKKMKYKKSEEDPESGVKILDKNIIQISKDDQLRDLEERKRKDEFIQATYKCEDCALTFKHAFYLENHMKRHDISKGEMECWLCKMRFSKYSTKKNHVRNHAIRLVCHMCPYKTNVKVRLLRHLKWHAGYSYTCRICGLAFTANHLLEKHETGHRYEVIKFDESEERPSFSCDICNKVCTSEGYLLNHMKVHSAKSDQYYCVECDVYFKSEYSLNYHLKFSLAHKDPALLKIKCEKCSKRFESEEQLSSHIQTSHEKIPRHSCEVCGARYVTKQGLNLHRRKAHEGFVLPLKYDCPYCGKKFTSSSLLNSHIRTHTGERPFECSQCDWKFTQQSALRTHIKLKHLKTKRSANSIKKTSNELSEELSHSQTNNTQL